MMESILGIETLILCSDIWHKENVIWEQLLGWRKISSQKLEN